MLFAHAQYRADPLSPIAAIYLEGFHASEATRASDTQEGPHLDELDYQRAAAMAEGARRRALEAGIKNNHAEQAATLLVMVDELDRLLTWFYSIAGKLQLDDDETGAIKDVREAAVSLLRWHFENGAGALRPIALDLGLLQGIAT